MMTSDYLNILKNEIHSTVFATVDENGHPVARVIDIMLVDEESLYFITAKGKEFYRHLTEKKYVAISGMTGGKDSLSKKAISIRGKAENIGSDRLDEVFKENPYMAEIYPDKGSRMALTVFRIAEGVGEFFNLSTKPITRDTFYIGDQMPKEKKGDYIITDRCKSCGMCYSKCPQKCIDTDATPYIINQKNCLHCGNCIAVCPFNAVEKN